MVRALAGHDLAAVFRHLSTMGLSQRKLAATIGMNQSGISEVLNGRRVRAYDVLVRIADGLGIPRGLLGLAYCGDGGVSIVDLPALSVLADPSLPPMRVVTVEVCQRCTTEATMDDWTGLEIAALRRGLRMTVREFAGYLGVSDRVISKWESGGASIRPFPINQAALDTALARCDAATRRRFAVALAVARATFRE
jgi:transcriptional regulator with XRE-family HTH domain